MSRFWKEQVGSGQSHVQSQKQSLCRDAEMMTPVNSDVVLQQVSERGLCLTRSETPLGVWFLLCLHP